MDYSNQFADSTIWSFKQISRLEFLTISYSGLRLDWSNDTIRLALLHLLHLPTLTHFEMPHIDNFVVSDLIPCTNLKYLDIGLFTTVAAEKIFPAALPQHSIKLNEFAAGNGTSDAIMKLCTAFRPDGQPIIDFGSLSKITLVIEQPNEGEASEELLRRCHVLTNVTIFCK